MESGKPKNIGLQLLKETDVKNMSSSGSVKEDPVKIHREGTALYDEGKYKEAIEKFLKASELYKQVGNYFDASYALFKAAECSYLQKDYETAMERFLKSADLALEKAFDRFALGSLEYALDCYKAQGKEKKATELKKKIKELKEKVSAF
jgi:tetratricopeptide (TPR) repeat protein